MKVTAWTNARPNLGTGSGFGIRLRKVDRDLYFDKSHPRIKLHLKGGQTLTIDLSRSFWRGCTEIRSKEIGKWILDQLGQEKTMWPKGRPPAFDLIPLSKDEFELAP